MREPARYFTNNLGGSLSLLDAMVQAGVKHIVFSSTAAVYGNPQTSPILETFPIQAINPYGESKVMVETLLRWFDQIHQLTSVCLRYFNASGADPDGRAGRRARTRNAPDSAGSRAPCRPASRSPFSATIMPRPTAPASAITST